MNIKLKLALFAFLISSNLWPSSAAFAFSETLPIADGTYRRAERQYVTSDNAGVESVCEPGDVAVHSECRGHLVESPDLSRRLELESAVRLESAPSTAGFNGVSCHPVHLKAGQVLKVESLVVCKKAS